MKHFFRRHEPRPSGRGFGSRAVLVAALAVSIALHVVAGFWPVEFDELPATPTLTATLLELPPPPAAVVATATPEPKHKPKRKPRKRATPAPPPVLAPEQSQPQLPEPEPDPTLAAAGPVPESAATGDDARSVPTEAPAPPTSEAEAVAQEPASPAPELAAAKTLPPRVDLVYRGFIGTRGFFVGDATYRLEHADNHYTISTIGQARGLAALFFRGQGKITSRGSITPNGLQPDVYSVERIGTHQAERATFDWNSGTVSLKDDKTVPIELPTYDPMAMMWQFYFAPPERQTVQFNIVTTRRLYHYSFRRASNETIELSFGPVETQVWKRESGDGAIDATVWLAPSLHFVAAKLRLSSERGTVEALLDSIHVDEATPQ